MRRIPDRRRMTTKRARQAASRVGRTRSSPAGSRAGEAEPLARLQRLVDAGARLHALQGSDAVCELALAEASAFVHARRAMLVLLDGGVGLHVAALIAARRGGRRAAAGHRAGAPKPGARNARACATGRRARRQPTGCIAVAPLVAQARGALPPYADVEGGVGRIDGADRDALVALAAQTAAALANLNTRADVANRLAGRTAELEQRDAELAVINGTSRACPNRATFAVSSKWSATGCAPCSAATTSPSPGVTPHRDGTCCTPCSTADVEPPPLKPDPDGRFMRTLLANRPVLINSRAEMDAWGLRPPEGMTPSLATLTVPIFAGDRLLGGITLDSHDPARQFGADDQRLLQTVAAAMGVALENARLFDETKEALERQTATAEILKIISGSPTDTQPVFESIARNAAALCGGMFANVLLFDGTRQFLHAAMTIPILEPVADPFPSRTRHNGRPDRAGGTCAHGGCVIRS
jgi:hypothetical protein